MKVYDDMEVRALTDNQIFVFGSNTEGRHGAGAARTARDLFGAVYGQAEGLQGRSYAIITKDLTVKEQPSRTREQIMEQISELYRFAEDYPDLDFLIPYSGEGRNLNFHSPEDMAEMFFSMPVPDNICFKRSFFNLMK